MADPLPPAEPWGHEKEEMSVPRVVSVPDRPPLGSTAPINEVIRG